MLVHTHGTMLEMELIVEELKEKSIKIRLQNLEQRISSLVGEWLHGNCCSGQANRGKPHKIQRTIVEKLKQFRR